jgi:hypothetical protein
LKPASFHLQSCWSRELQLVTAAAAAGWDKTAAARAEACIASGPDWEVVCELAGRHRLVPLLYTNIASMPGVPDATLATLRARFEASAHHALQLSAALLRVMEALRAADVSVVAYKGPVWAQRLYGNIALRTYSDLDLLIAPADRARAMAILAGLGYTSNAPSAEGERQAAGDCEEELASADGSVLVDLHWAIAQPYYSFGPLPADWQQRTYHAAVGTGSVPTFSPQEELLVMVVHGAKHRWERLSWLLDLARALAIVTIDWDSLLRAAASMRIRHHVLLAVSLAHVCLGSPVPDAILAAAREAGVPWEYAENIAHSYAAETPHAARLRRWMFHLRMRERWSDRARAAFRFAFHADAADLSSNPMPRYGSFLYPAVRASRVAGRALRAAAGADVSDPRSGGGPR